jgi:hypothetical protein
MLWLPWLFDGMMVLQELGWYFSGTTGIKSLIGRPNKHIERESF